MGLIILATACASADKGAARKEIGSAESAINQARTGSATQSSPLELRLAEDKLARANAAFEEGEYETAERLAEQASADATLAEARAQNVKTKEMVRTLQDSISQLRREIEHSTTVQ
ncbi:MAG: DUF4398 domain-containing protein [bacterium]